MYLCDAFYDNELLRPNYDPTYAIRVASERFEDVEREIAAVKDKINSIPVIVQHQIDI